MHTAYVTSNGRLTIPAELRRKHKIKKGTRVTFIEDNDRIIMQPVTREFINSLCGMFKLKPGEKLATQELLEDRAEDRRREEKKIARHGF